MASRSVPRSPGIMLADGSTAARDTSLAVRQEATYRGDIDSDWSALMKAYLPINPAIPDGATVIADNTAAATIGILDDNLDPPFMGALVKGLRDRYPDTKVRLWVKPIGTAPAPESLIDEMAKEVQIAISGIGL
jgi:hypothetical protein